MKRAMDVGNGVRAAICLLVLAGACGSPPASEPQAPPVSIAAPTVAAPASSWTVVDLMPGWWRAAGESAGAGPAEQRAAFRRHLVDAHPEAFSEEVLSLDRTAPFDLDARIDAFLVEAPALEPVMRRLSQQVAADLPRHRASFEAAFPSFAWKGRVYFTVSLFAFDGAVREIGGAPALLFGLDKVAKLHGDQASLAPLFHHELFHVYHVEQGKPFEGSEENRMYQALWAEGLAVHVARALNPGATNQQLVLTDDMVRRGEAMLPALAAELLANLDSTDPAFYRDWFRGAGKRQDIPIRVGYFLGMRVAEVLGRGRSLQELAMLRDPTLRQEIARALETLASAAAAAPSAPGR